MGLYEGIDMRGLAPVILTTELDGGGGEGLSSRSARWAPE
jgi:hypothetical protein